MNAPVDRIACITAAAAAVGGDGAAGATDAMHLFSSLPPLLLCAVLDNDSDDDAAVSTTAAFRLPPTPAPRQDAWFSFCVPHLSDSAFIENFRVSRTTAEWLYQELYRLLDEEAKARHRQLVGGRPPLPFDKRLLIALYRLASSAHCVHVASLFGVSKSEVVRATDEIVSALAIHLFPSWVNVGDVIA